LHIRIKRKEEKKMVNDPDDVIGVCSECQSDQPNRYMVNSPFAQEGKNVPCKYCGGVVIITYRETRDDALDQSDNNRGAN
jgi:DNA-directed RNA polymerase subunit RPC12/RpoP